MSIRVLIIADEARHREEGAALRRFAVGLAAEGLRPAMLLGVSADSVARRTPRLGPVPSAEVPLEVPWWLRERAAEAVLAPLAGTRLDRPDVVIVSGRGAMPIARTIAELTEALLVADVRHRVDAEALDDRIAVAAAATPALRELAATRLGAERAVELPVPVPRTASSISRTPGLLVVLGPVRDLAAWSALADGLSGPGGPLPGLEQIAIELGDRARDGVLWKRLRRSAIADRVTSFDRADRLRDPLSTADVVVLPDAGSPVRSLERQIAGRGGVVVAVEDRWRDDLQADLDARILTRGTARRPMAWREAIESALSAAPSEAATRSGRDSLVSRVAPRWAAMLEEVLHGDATPIEAGRSA